MTYNGAADGNTAAALTHVGTIDDAVVVHFFSAYRDTFGQVQSTDANGVLLWQNNATPPVQQASATAGMGFAPVMRNMTDAETWEKYTQGIAEGTAALVQRYLEKQALAAALSLLPNVTVTQQS
jgi:hypothetical protein